MTDRTLTVTLLPRTPAVNVLRVTGELDHHTAPDLREALEAAPLVPGGALVLDLSSLTYCDSTGITVLISAYHRAAGAGSAFVIAGLNDDLKRVFGIIGLDQVFTFHPSVEDAVSAQRS
ncbi:STAS domain-containing protein [Streptomyces pactum]|uniref:Anti-sigma factor antagonist n=1 Tax=Streptomyces pactum TaxID=68249 RepID=A0ABS0NU66_9ACTN|nr:STAS domain-containing protein [Streptomyces pactum]MBH5338757.1 STAS domain-containing protein [Streptomyces pactum]